MMSGTLPCISDKHRRGLGLAVSLLAMAVYVPYVFWGGLVCDDWAVWSRAYEYPGFWATYRSWFPLFANRPLAPLILAAAGNWLGGWVTGYVLVNLAFYGAAIGLTAAVLYRRLGREAAIVFVLLALCPSLSSTLIFSPGMQLLGTSTLFLWALSLALLDRHVTGGGWGSLLASHAAVLVALLTYEVFVPLLVFNLTFPWLFGREGQERPAWSTAAGYLTRYLGPLMGILMAVVMLQKLVVPALVSDYSRLSNAAFFPAIRSLAYWAFALLVQFPVLLIDGLWRTDLLTALVVALALGTLWLGLVASSPQEKASEPGRVAPHSLPSSRSRVGMVFVAAAALAGTSVLYVLSGSYAAVYGYDNRVLSSAWWAVALLAASLTWPLGGRLGFRLALAVLVALNTGSFVVQRNNHQACQPLQERIVATLVNWADRQSVPRDAVILAQVPALLPQNYNDEPIFTRPWDMVNAVRHYRPERLDDVVPISPILVRKGRVEVDAEGITIDGLWRGRLGRLWFFTYDGDRSTLIPVRDVEHLRELIDVVGRSPTPPSSAAARLTEQVAGTVMGAEFE
jgi:hypothetical protein